MNNIFKRFLASVLALAMILGCMTVSFAAEETIEWNVYGIDEDAEHWVTYPWLGDLSSGETKGGKDSPDFIVESYAYGFTAESEGFYRFTLSDLTYTINNGVFFSESFVDGKAYGMITEWEFYQRQEGETDFIVYLPSGKIAVLLQCIEELTVTYEFLGKEVSDLVLDEKCLTGILGSDFYSGSDYSYGYDFCGELFFDSGKSYKFTDSYFCFEEKLVKNENTVTFKLLGFEKQATLTVVEPKDVIAKLEPVNLEDDLFVTEYYNGYISADDIGEAQLKITYADGTEETVDFDGGDAVVTLPNGRRYGIGISFEIEALTAELYFAEELYETYDLEIKPASFEENVEKLGIENEKQLDKAERDMNWRIDRLDETDSLSEKISLVFWIPFLYTDAFYQIFCNVVEFIEFYA